jgi:hypothetical protein
MRATRICVLLLAASTGLSPAARADDLKLDGKPDGVAGNQTKRYYVWRDKDGVHLRFTTEGVKHRFSGEIKTTAGSFLKPTGIEDGAEAKDGEWWTLSEKGQVLKFDRDTRKTLDGLDFRLGNRVREIEFVLKIDGEELPARIFVGPSGTSPKIAKFTLATP